MIDPALVAQHRQARLAGGPLTAHHFAEQREFYRPRRKSLRACLCSRRAGKTRGGNESDLELASKTPNGRFLYINETRAEAKRLAWYGARGDGMMALARDRQMDVKINEAELTIQFPALNSWIYLIGVDDEAAIRKALGMPWHRVRWDEAQRIPPKFNVTILETLLPALLDYGGEFLMTGTPERKMSGLFYDVTRLDRAAKWKAWEVARWTLMANPYWGREKRIDGQWFVVWGALDEVVSGPHEVSELPAAVQAARHLTGVLGLQELLGGPDVTGLDSPLMRRQAMGEWVKEDSNFVYAVNKVSDATLLYAPHRTREDGFVDVEAALRDLPYPWQQGVFALGVDLGYNDPFALTLWSWHPQDSKLYEVCAWKKSGLDSDEQNECIKAIRAHVAIGMIDADAGGIGKQVTKGWSKEWVSRYGLPIVEAEKQHKLTAIQTMNTDILAGRVKFRDGSPLIAEMRELQWSTTVDGSGKLFEDPTLANDVCDSSLYAHRRSWHFRGRLPESLPAPGSPARYAREAAALEDDIDEDLAANERGYRARYRRGA